MSIHDEAIVFDAHCDTALRFIRNNGFDIGARHGDGHVDIPRMREGGVDAQVFAAWVDPEQPEEGWVKNALELIEAIKKQVDSNPGDIELAGSGGEIERIELQGRIAAVIGIEGGHVLGGKPSVLGKFYDLGVRCLTLTWMNTNALADSENDAAEWNGLSGSGREVVKEMDSLGMVIDCAHASERTFFDVLDTTGNPVVISHSCMRALCDIPRNVSDEELRALRDNGGVVCVNFFPGFLEKGYFDEADGYFRRFTAERRRLAEKYGGDLAKAEAELKPECEKVLKDIPRPSVSTVVDHIEHAVEVAGVEHVGLGSDFDGIPATPVGLEDAGRYPAITEELVRRGYGEEDIKRVLGGNLLRVFKQVCR